MKVDDYLRSFGMSGYLVTEELSEIERKFNIELGHTARGVAGDPAEYYPQFEQSVRAVAAAMAVHYELFYCLEQAIRKLISEILGETDPSGWWAARVPSNTQNEVKDRIQKERDAGITLRSDHPIDYTTFGELSVIINSNWELFNTIFSSRRAVERVMSNLNALRNPIAHCSPLSEDEVDRLHLTVKDWFRMIG